MAMQWKCLCFALVSMVMSYSVSAAVIYEDVGFMADGQTMTHKLSLAESGSYKISLVDYAFPDPFGALELSVTNSSYDNIVTLSGTSDFMLQSSADVVWLSLFAEINSGLGLFGLQVEYLGKLDPAGGSPVPVPASILLLISGLLPLVGLKRGVR